MTDPDKVRELIDHRGAWLEHEQIEVAWACAALLQRVTELEAAKERRNPWEWTDPGSPLQERAARLRAMSGNRDALVTEMERVYIAEGLWFAEEALKAEQHNAALREALREAQRTIRAEGYKDNNAFIDAVLLVEKRVLRPVLASYLSEGEKP